TVTISVALKGGHLLEGNDLSKAGWASLFAAMMNEDTKNYSSEQMSTELEKLGSSVGVSSQEDAIVFTVQSLKKNVDKTLALLQEKMLNPSFKQDVFDRMKRQIDQRLRNAKSQPAAVATSVYDKLNYGDKNILGIPDIGTPETIKN